MKSKKGSYTLEKEKWTLHVYSEEFFTRENIWIMFNISIIFKILKKKKHIFSPIFFSQCFGGQLCWVQHSSCCIVFTWFVKRQNFDFYKEQTLVSKKMKLYWDSPAALGRMCLRWKVKHDWDSCQRIYWEGKKYLVLKNYREVKRNCHLLCFLQFYNSTRIFFKEFKVEISLKTCRDCDSCQKIYWKKQRIYLVLKIYQELKNSRLKHFWRCVVGRRSNMIATYL